MPESLPGNRSSPASIISTLKELVALLRDACLLILAVLLIAFPANLNDLLVTAGFKKGSIAGFEWEAVVKSDQALKDALARINELTAQNQQFDQLLKEARARAADPQEKARLQALEDQNRSLRAATAETTSSVLATIASTSAVVAQAQAVVAEHTQWGIVFGGDPTLKEAEYEAVLEPIWARREALLNDPDQLRGIVEKGNDKARKVAQETMQFVRKAMGLY